MRIVLTGDTFRPGQQRNIAHLARTVGPALDPRIPFEVHLGHPLEFDAWVEGYFTNRMHMPERLVIGFELPPGFRFSLEHWIDIRVHPLRFLPKRRWSVEASDSMRGAIDRAVGQHCVWVERPAVKPIEVGESTACLTLQVQHDAALIGKDGLLQPADVMPELRAFAERFDRLLVVPHPEQPHNDWRDAVLEQIPNAEPTLFPAYTVMSSVREMVTVSSSTGFEAPWMGPRPGCRPTVLRPPWWQPSAPIDITSRAFWAAVLEG